ADELEQSVRLGEDSEQAAIDAADTCLTGKCSCGADAEDRALRRSRIDLREALPEETIDAHAGRETLLELVEDEELCRGRAGDLAAEVLRAGHEHQLRSHAVESLWAHKGAIEEVLDDESIRAAVVLVGAAAELEYVVAIGVAVDPQHANAVVLR